MQEKNRKIEFTPSAIPLNNFISPMISQLYDTDVDFQRPYIWKKEYKMDLIFSIFQGLPIGTIIVWDNFEKNYIIDGKQRISTIRDFKNNMLSLSPEITKKIINLYKNDIINYDNNENDIKLISKIQQDKKISLKYDNLPKYLKEIFANYLISIITIRYANENQIREYFVAVQNAESLKKGQILNVNNTNEIINYIKSINLREVATKLNFNDKYDELLKILTMMHGIFDKKIQLGTSDNNLINYISKNNILIHNFRIRLDLFLKKLNDFKGIHNKKMNKGLIKLIFIEVFFGNWWIDNDIEYFLNKIIKIYENSKKMLFNNKDFNKDESINVFIRFIVLSRGSHSYDYIVNTILEFDNILINEKKY